ncbi:hypothetical protein L1887_02147 [Cichorium endivia]|nr:hypothetical protein L1887_02147 [Cichorium endivia]
MSSTAIEHNNSGLRTNQLTGNFSTLPQPEIGTGVANSRGPSTTFHTSSNLAFASSFKSSNALATRISLENSNQLLTSQRDLVQSDNVRLNKLVDQLYHATEIFKSPANTNSSENTFNWGWDLTKNVSKITIFESENAISDLKEGVRIPFSYFTEEDTAENSKFNCITEEFNPCHIDSKNSKEENVDEEIEMEKRPSNVIMKNDFNKIIIKNLNVVNTSNTTSEPSCSDTNSYVDVLQLNFSNNSNSNKPSLEKLKVNHEESDSLNDSLSDSSPRKIFQKGKGQNLTKNGVKPILNRKDLRSPRSHARIEQRNYFYTQRKPKAKSTFITPSHTQKSTPLTSCNACSMHMTGRLEFLRDYREVSFGGYVTFGNDANGIIKGYGVLTNGNFTIQKVAYVLGLIHNLVSIDARDRCLVKSPKQLNMFPLDISMFLGKPRCLLSKAHSEVSWLWHRKLAHLNFRYMNQLVTGEMVRGMPLLKFDNENICAACALGKQKKKPHKTITDSSITHPLELLHIHLCGPSTVASLNHTKYILVIVDDYSRFTWVQLPVRRIRSDNGTEFNNGQIEEFISLKGIQYNVSAPYTPQQNDVVERRNRTLVEAARSMLNFENLPLTFWAEAIATTCFVQNRSIINKRLLMTPYEI